MRAIVFDDVNNIDFSRLKCPHCDEIIASNSAINQPFKCEKCGKKIVVIENDATFVCDKCLRLSCLDNSNPCEYFDNSGTRLMELKELNRLNFESPAVWINLRYENDN